MDEFTPTTSDLCDAWGYFRHEGTDWGNPAYCKGFNRWLASVKAEAWDEGFDAGIDHAILKDFVFNPYSIKSERAQKYIEKTLSEATE